MMKARCGGEDCPVIILCLFGGRASRAPNSLNHSIRSQMHNSIPTGPPQKQENHRVSGSGRVMFRPDALNMERRRSSLLLSGHGWYITPIGDHVAGCREVKHRPSEDNDDDDDW